MRNKSRQVSGSSHGGKDHLLALGLAQGMTKEGAAKYAEMTKITAYKRFRDPEFIATVERYRDMQVKEIVGSLSDAANQAVERLRVALCDPDPRVYLVAAKILLDNFARVKGDGDNRPRVIDVPENRQEIIEEDPQNEISSGD